MCSTLTSCADHETDRTCLPPSTCDQSGGWKKLAKWHRSAFDSPRLHLYLRSRGFLFWSCLLNRSRWVGVNTGKRYYALGTG